MSLPASQPSELDSFIDFLYSGSEGYIYLAAKVANDESDWKQEFFHYPNDTAKLKAAIKGATPTHEVYIAPALFKNPTDGKKENFKSSNVVWIDFDGNAPADWSDFAGPPSLIMQTSIEGRQHVYWRLTNPLNTAQEVEDINRSLAYNFQADNSGWDSVQVLRPPETYNHGNSGPVKVLSRVDAVYDTTLFDSLPPIPAPIKSDWQLSELPNTQDVILRYSFPEDLVQLLKKQKNEIKDRSKSLQHLAYGCCEAGMSDNEVFVVLRMADDIWEKFKYRRDRDKRLADIILYARNKHPFEESSTLEPQDAILAYNYTDFLAVQIELNWVAEGMLMEGGNMLWAGPSGVGKTQFTLEFLKHVALGKDFLHYKIPKPLKVGFLSLEMGHPDLQVFMRKQDESLTEPERQLLKENFTVVPHGEAWALNTPVGQERLLRLIDYYRWEGLGVDSVGSAILGNLSSSEVVQPFTNFNDRLRKNFGLFLWYIHHMRKAQPGGHNRIDQNDVYGDQYLVNRCTSSYAMLPSRADSIRLRNIKNRLAPMEHDYFVKRTTSLGFDEVERPTQVNASSTNELPSPNLPGEETHGTGAFKL